MISIQASVSKGWLYQQGGFTFEERYYFDPLFRSAQDSDINAFLQQQFPDYPLYNMESNLVQKKYWHEKQLLVGGVQPNLIIAAALGAEFFFPIDKDADIKTKPLQEKRALPQPTSFFKTAFVQKLDHQIQTLQKQYPQFPVIPPFFWDSSGRATIHGLITTAQKLRGESIFMDLFDDPQNVHDFFAWIAEVYAHLVKHFAHLAKIKITSLHVGECSGSMLNQDQFKTFILPHIDLLARKIAPLRFHTCGKSDHLIEAMALIKNIDIVDTGSDTSVAKLRQFFGETKAIHIAPPVRILLRDAEPQQGSAWVKKVLKENRNGPLQIAYHLEPGYSLENCLNIHDELYHQGVAAARGRE